PLAGTAGTMTVKSQPDDTWVVGIDMPIKLAFSEAIDVHSVNASTIVVTDGAGLRVFGAFAASPDNKTVTFTPLRRFRYSTKYRSPVTPGVTASSGARLQSTYTRTFTTFEPRTLSSPDVGEAVRDVKMAGNLAVTAGPSGLTVLGLANPTQPVFQSRVVR